MRRRAVRERRGAFAAITAVLAAVVLGVVTTGVGGARAAADVAGVAGPGPRAASQVEGGPLWAWPVAGPAVIAPFVAPATQYAAGHRGIDLGASAGTPVSAPSDAVVRFAGVVVDRPVLTLDHGDGVLSSYEPVVSELPVGTVVARGGVVGAVGAGGHCDARCLHVGVRVDGEYVSPLLFFGRVPPAVLLPLGHG